MNERKREDLEADLHVWEVEMLPEYQSRLDYLIAPNYDPADNPDHDFRDEDIENLSTEIYLIKQRIARIRAALA